MKKSILKWYMFAFVVLSGFTMVAQTSPTQGATDEEGNPQEGDDSGLPIDGKLFYLGAAAVVLSGCYFYNKRQLKA